VGLSQCELLLALEVADQVLSDLGTMLDAAKFVDDGEVVLHPSRIWFDVEQTKQFG
jgi:hypothetical protein